MKTLLKHILICTTIALLAACGSQDGANSGTNTPLAGVNIDSTAPNTIANEQVSNESKLLTSLAANYPNGQLPPERTAQAALDLVQNPAALKQTALQTAPIQAQSGSIQAQSGSIQPQAFAVPRVTSTDYLPVQRIQNTTLYGAYFFSIYAGEVTSALAGNPNWRLEGPAFWASLVTGVELNPVHRFQNKLNGSYLYTIYDGERANIVANYSATFTYEGIAWYARQTPATGWSALYRFRNKTNGTYLFSAYESEKNAIVANYPEVFELEGIAYYVRQDAPSAAVMNPIAMDKYQTCALKSDTTVNCWGDNTYGELGDGTTVSKTVPTTVPGLLGVVSVELGERYSCALKSDGTVSCWGFNAFGSLGDGSYTDRLNPTAIPGLTGVMSLAAGRFHTCALKSDGTVSCWGSNSFGQLGNGTTDSTNSPATVPGLTGVIAIAAGEQHMCAVKTGGTVNCWGFNGLGQLGDGTTTNRFNPTPVPNLSGVVSLSGYIFYTCALKSNGKVYCWGANSNGELGDGTTTNSLVPSLTFGAETVDENTNGLSQVVSISSGAGHTCAVKSGGTVHCWGANFSGQLGDGTGSSRRFATRISGLTGVASVALGGYSSCAIKTDGAVLCWGSNDTSQLGDGTTTNKPSPTPVLGGAVYWK